MRRITFGGEDLAAFVWSGPAAHIKIIFPEPGSGIDIVPLPDPDAPRPTTTRTYTPRRFDPAAHTLEVDFALHGPGPAATWAAQARVGQQLILMGPARGYEIDVEAPWYVLLGDDAALPALETILDALPATTRRLRCSPKSSPRTKRVRCRARRRTMSAGSSAAPTARRGRRCSRPSRGHAWPPGEGRVYVGCESGAMRELRGAILAASGPAKEHVVARGYWRTGAVNHPDHDYVND